VIAVLGRLTPSLPLRAELQLRVSLEKREAVTGRAAPVDALRHHCGARRAGLSRQRRAVDPHLDLGEAGDRAVDPERSRQGD
jgi:hypothetical protein